MRIGLLGGTFDPAHNGHAHVAHVAATRLGLDRVWWLVTPQNPLKPKATPLKERMASARAKARGRKHIVTDLESRLGLTFTVDTARRLQQIYPGVRFVLVMGADNMETFARWRRWPLLLQTLPAAIVSRPSAGARARFAPPFRRFAAARKRDGQSLFASKPPAWVFLTARFSPLSSTAIRSRTR
ncbi:MAG: nicotinate-nicotinamide nucleotide adenylyltransferase [Hyphomonadaceae bacterium]|nr:nicotinate-nicotinamide nucleotide adenylyltransferase [Hyphomonadaceae bacterium]